MQLRAAPLLVALIAFSPGLLADELRVAVASNFSATMDALASHFEEMSDHRIVSVPSSSGKHYTQIRNGAPFHVFLSADAHRPQLLEEEGLAVAGSRFTYAIGRLVLWSPTEGYVDSSGEVLATGDFHHLAIANPQLAPYGRAAREVLESRQLWRSLDGRIAQGENVAQAFQFVRTGNAQLGFVALSQLISLGEPPIPGSSWQVPEDLYRPIEQQAVLLADGPAARQLIQFLQSDETRALIRHNGYNTP